VADAGIPPHAKGKPPVLHIPTWLDHAIATYGYWAVFVAVALESTGVPFPGETALLAAAVYAGTGHSLSIAGVIVAAAAGAILGDNTGYAVGHFGGYRLIQRFGYLVRLDDKKLSAAQRYFEQHGNKTVFFGRFISILRTWVAFLAGVNRMPWPLFLFWNASGGIVWATFYGLLGYFLGRNIPLLEHVLRVIGIGGVVAVGAVVVALLIVWWLRRRAAQRAERETVAEDARAPDPLPPHLTPPSADGGAPPASGADGPGKTPRRPFVVGDERPHGQDP
jgi:membrane protein DedA with SNARE-associated domain